MLVVIVHAHVKEEIVQAFIDATLDNAGNSMKEQGVIRFDFYQQTDDPSRFTLVEIYRSEEAPGKHKETEHYIRWKNTVETMLVEPRTRVTFNALFPPIIEK